MIKTTPVVFGTKPEPRMKGSKMSLGNSKYIRPKAKKPTVVWHETTINEGTVTDLIAVFLQQINAIKRFDDIGRVILGDLKDGQYSLTYTILKGKEVKEVG